MLKYLIIILSCILLTVCQAEPEITGFNMSEFQQKRALWEAQDISDYFVTEEFKTFHFGTLKGRIEVEDGEIIKEYLGSNTTEEEELSNRFITISELFDYILLEYNSYGAKVVSRGDSFRLEVTYNNVWHYPEYIYSSTIYNGKGNIDYYKDRQPTIIILSNFELVDE